MFILYVTREHLTKGHVNATVHLSSQGRVVHIIRTDVSVLFFLRSDLELFFFLRAGQSCSHSI